MALFTKTDDALPCSRLALTAHEFNSLVSGRGSISSFLRVIPRRDETSPAKAPHESPSSDPAKPRHKASTVKYLDEREASGGTSLPQEVVEGVRGGEDRDVSSRRLGRAATDPQDPSSCGSRSSSSCGGDGGSGSSKCVGRDAERSHRARSDGEARSPLRSGQQRCPKCERNLAAGEDLQEHLDFHYAEGLQERYAREGDVARDMAARMSDRGGISKRPRHDAASKGSKSLSKRQAGRRIDSFFKPT